MNNKDLVFKVVSQIPKGKVTTYQVVAKLTGIKNARVVGNILHQNTNPNLIPCHRVVHKDGSLAKGYRMGGESKQRKKLMEEGVEFRGGKVEIKRHIWHPVKNFKDDNN